MNPENNPYTLPENSNKLLGLPKNIAIIVIAILAVILIGLTTLFILNQTGVIGGGDDIMDLPDTSKITDDPEIINTDTEQLRTLMVDGMEYSDDTLSDETLFDN